MVIYPVTQSADATLQVEPNTGSTASPFGTRLCTWVIMHSSGTLAFKDRFGADKTLTGLPAGLFPVEMSAVNSGTNVKVTCLFFSGDGL